MCTVSFYCNNEKVIITSNRDEHIDRPLALFPLKYTYNNTNLYFPKDQKAGGSWFVVNEQNNVFVLLNGSKSKHIPKPLYRKSRGLILLDIACGTSLENIWKNIDLHDIEPFTVVAFVSQELIQLRWNGNSKEKQILDKTIPHIWSSSTLYEPEIIKNRERWFEEFLKDYKTLDEKSFINFHTNTYPEDVQNGLLINRNAIMITKNVTQCVINNNEIKFLHKDLLENKESEYIIKNETLVV